jgi:hypothetical protein
MQLRYCLKAGQPSAGIGKMAAAFQSRSATSFHQIHSHVTTGFHLQNRHFPFFNWKDCMTPA